MVEISFNPHKVISVAALESIINGSAKKVYVSFVDKGGIIHALDYGKGKFTFIPIAAAGSVPVMFEAASSVEAVGMALKSGYQVLKFETIDEMVRHYLETNQI